MRNFAPEVFDEEPYLYRNPVTGKRHIAFRERHDITRSPRLRFYRECVGDMTRGRRYRGMGPRGDSVAVREALSGAAVTCAQRDKAYPSDAR